MRASRLSRLSSRVRRLVVLLAAAPGCGGCLAVPFQVYVADPAAGTPVYSTCTFNHHVPAATAFEVDGVTVLISLAQTIGPRTIELRLDIPAGRTVVFEDNVIRVDFHSKQAPLEARFPNVSLVDHPVRPTETEAIREYLLPTTMPLVGERIVRGPSLAWDKHFWIGTRVDVGNADEFWVELPPFTINGVAAPVPPLRFQRRMLWGIALMNC